MKTVLLLLALSLGAGAQTLGTLSHIHNGRAVLLEGSQPQTYEVPPDLARLLKARGIGSRWEYEPMPGQIHEAIDRGNDREVQTALQTLNQFVQAVNAQQWEKAQKLSAQPLPGPFAQHTLSAQRSDWSLTGSKPGRITLKIQTTQGSIYNATNDWPEDPQTFTNEFTLVQQDNRWTIESFR